MQVFRARALQQVQAGVSRKFVPPVLGISRSEICVWLARYPASGCDPLRVKRIPGRQPRLSGRMIRWAFATVTLKNPLQFRSALAAWTRGDIARLTEQRLGVSLSVTSVGRLLPRLGFACKSPLFKAYQQYLARLKHWLREDYPRIRGGPAQAGTEIYFRDEPRLRSDRHAGTTCGVRGQTPVLRGTGARFDLNVFTAISAQGHVRFMLLAGPTAAEEVCELPGRLRYRATRPVFLIFNGPPIHKAKRICACVAEFARKTKPFFLPAYSPDLNPDELVWQNLETNGVEKQLVASAQEFHEGSTQPIDALDSLPRGTLSFVRAPHTQHAAL